DYPDDIWFPVDRARIVEWRSTASDGEPAVQLVEAGTLPRSATVGDLPIRLQRPGIEGGLAEFLAPDGAAVVIPGLLPHSDAYRASRLPMIYAGDLCR